ALPHHFRRAHSSLPPPPPSPTLFPYTTLFRSQQSRSLRNQLELLKTDITHKPSDSKFMALSNNPDAVDGKNASVGILDEYASVRSEEHTSELQSRFDLVCRLLLEKKKH